MIKLTETHKEDAKEEWFLHNNDLVVRIEDYALDDTYWIAPRDWKKSDNSEELESHYNK